MYFSNFTFSAENFINHTIILNHAYNFTRKFFGNINNNNFLVVNLFTYCIIFLIKYK